MSTDPLEAAVMALLRQAPDTWADTPLDNAAEAANVEAGIVTAQHLRKALTALTAADLIKRRCTFRIQLPGLEAKRIIIEASGEYGLIEAVEAIAKHLWAARDAQHWENLRTQTGESINPIVTRERDEWCITEQGRLARADLERGEQVPIDFVLWRGFFDGRPRLMPDGRITRRKPVRGSGHVISIENVDDKPLTVNIENIARFTAAPELAEAFRKALESMREANEGHGKAANGAPAKRRGRKKADYQTIQKEAQLAAEWAQARDKGVYKGDFAREKNMRIKELDRLLNRVTKRKRASE